MLALLLLISQLLLLAYFLFFAFYLIRYGLACFKKPFIKKADTISNDKVAVVIVSFNEKDILKDTHAACEKLTYENKVIIYADDSNDNYTFPMLKKFALQRGAKQVFDPRFDNGGKTIVYEAPDFVIFHRTYNVGFKAGSLKEIEKYLKARNFKYMYLLDADWEPQSDSIEKCMEVIEADKKIAYVQTKRISYYGKGENLQRCLALNEDGNYFVDLPGRQALGDIILFSGCCTLFRLEYLYKAKGFKPGHITEDMDLTNRYYLLGYKGVYLENVENIGDVPFHYTAYRRQQDRWARGTARCLKEYFWPIIKSRKMNFREKMSLIRQNAYFTTATGIEISIILAFFNVILLSRYADNYTTVLYEYYTKYIAWPYTILLLIALLSNFIPLLITCYKKEKI
jgi:cellulose synthase/poly-beta-1,6-N-acetylglucosamine synthase-like glycosyltransferase